VCGCRVLVLSSRVALPSKSAGFLFCSSASSPLCVWAAGLGLFVNPALPLFCSPEPLGKMSDLHDPSRHLWNFAFFPCGIICSLPASQFLSLSSDGVCLFLRSSLVRCLDSFFVLFFVSFYFFLCFLFSPPFFSFLAVFFFSGFCLLCSNVSCDGYCALTCFFRLFAFFF